MKVQALAVQGALALGGLLLAYTSWQKAPEAAPGSVVVVDVPKSGLQKVRFEGEGKYMELTADADKTLVKQGPLPLAAPPPPAAGADAGVDLPPNHPPIAIPERQMRGSERATTAFEKFAPFYAVRTLGVVSGDKLKELGFEGATKKLIVTTRSGEETFSIANPVVGSVGAMPYIRNEKDGKVYLVQTSILGDVENASQRLVDKGLHAFKLDDFDAITLSAAGPNSKKRELTKAKDPAGPNAYSLMPKGSDKKDDFAKNWHDKIWRLGAVDVYGFKEVPPGGEPAIVLRLDYTRAGKAVGHIEVAKGASGDFFGRTEHTAGWVKLPATVGETLKEAEKVGAGS